MMRMRGVQGVGVRPTGRHLHNAPGLPAVSMPRSAGCGPPRGTSVSASSSVRRLSAVVGVAAAVMGAVSLPAAAADHHQPSRHPAVYISGVQYDSPGRDDRSNRSLNKEWVDITNSTRQGVNLNGWTLSDEDGHTYRFRHVRSGWPAARLSVSTRVSAGTPGRTSTRTGARTWGTTTATPRPCAMTTAASSTPPPRAATTAADRH